MSRDLTQLLYSTEEFLLKNNDFQQWFNLNFSNQDENALQTIRARVIYSILLKRLADLHKAYLQRQYGFVGRNKVVGRKKSASDIRPSLMEDSKKRLKTMETTAAQAINRFIIALYIDETRAKTFLSKVKWELRHYSLKE